jgi:nucleoside-diphosphate-sugar epimerase
MKIMVTGGTGFVGAHTVRALHDAGHDVRLLVRDPRLIEKVLHPLGVLDVEHVTGDATDAESVSRALDGCDAVVHAAAVVAIQRARAEEVLSTNARAAAEVLGAAHRAGLDPIVHVSSVSALSTEGGRQRPDSPIASAANAYARSKAESERYARRLQAEGAPVVITYPAMVLGPPAGSRRTADAGNFLIETLKRGAAIATDGAWSVVDARDVAAVHTAAMQPGRGPRRFTAGGEFVAYRDVLDVLERLTGRRLRRLSIPTPPLRVLANVAEVIGRAVPLPSWLTREALTSVVDAVPVDDSRTTAELGVEFRPAEATLAATVRGLYDAGELTAAQVGALAG